MRRTLLDVLVSGAALAVLAVVLACLDQRVRRALLQAVRGATPAVVADIAADLYDVVGVVVASAREQSLEHAALATLVVAAVALFAFMLRT